MNSPTLYIEIGQTFFRALNASGAGLELALERFPDGRLEPACRTKVAAELAKYLNRKNWHARVHAWCAIGARGVSLRRLSLPAAGNGQLRQVLELQIESEFPLAPSELAWGYRKIGSSIDSSAVNGSARQEVLVMAVRKEAVQEFADIFKAAGIDPVFTVAALARTGLCAQLPLSYAVLNVGADQSELAVFDQGAPASLSVLPPGPTLTQKDTEEKLGRNGYTLYQTGVKPVAPIADAQLLDFQPGPGRSSATEGLQKLAARHQPPPIVLLMGPDEQVEAKTHNVPWKWIAVIGALVLAMILAPYGVAEIGKARLQRKLAAIKADRSRLTVIDQELGFLQNLKTRQAPYLTAMYIMSDAAPQGTKFDSIAMTLNGDVSLRANLQNNPAQSGQSVSDFRAKLLASGFFANVVVEEQTPTQDRQRVNIRLTTQWKPAEARERLNIGPKIDESKTNTAATPTNRAATNSTPMPTNVAATPPPANIPASTPPPTLSTNSPPGASPPPPIIEDTSGRVRRSGERGQQ